MPYTDMSDEERILHAAECVGRGVPIPHQIKTILGYELIMIIALGAWGYRELGAEHDK